MNGSSSDNDFDEEKFYFDARQNILKDVKRRLRLLEKPVLKQLGLDNLRGMKNALSTIIARLHDAAEQQRPIAARELVEAFAVMRRESNPLLRLGHVLPEYKEVVPFLIVALRIPNPDLRRRILSVLADEAKLNGLSSYEQAIPALTKVLDVQDVELRTGILSVLDCLEELAHHASIISTLKSTTLRAGDPRLAVSSLALLRRFRIEGALPALDSVVDLLTNTNEQVVCEACRTLRWFGKDARNAVKELLHATIWHDVPSVNQEAAMALCQIDPDGEVIYQVLARESDQIKFIELLTSIGGNARPLRHALQSKWSRSTRGSSCPLPCLEAVWHEFTTKECELIATIWNERRPDGIPVDVLHKRLWGQSGSPDKSLRTHLSNITRKLTEARIPLPWKRERKRIYLVRQ